MSVTWCVVTMQRHFLTTVPEKKITNHVKPKCLESYLKINIKLNMELYRKLIKIHSYAILQYTPGVFYIHVNSIITKMTDKNRSRRGEKSQHIPKDLS